MRFPFPLLLTVLAGLFLAGCSGLDDLQVVNNYPFAVVLRHKDGGESFTVPERTTLTFSGAGGYEGGSLDGLRVEDAHQKPLETLNPNSPNVEKQGERLNGSTTWSVTLGPPPPAAPPFSGKPFSVGWVVVGFLFLIAWIEWRAHRNEKIKPVS